MSQVSTTFSDSTYSASNKPSVTTLKADIQALETAHNETDTYAIRKDGTVAMAADLAMGGNQITNVGTPGAATDAATLATAQAMWPIGSVFTAVVSTNPGTLLGFGTWSSIAAGRMLIGLDSGDSKFDTVEETGGAETVQLTTTELPAHTHTGTTASNGAHTHNVEGSTTGGSGGTRIDAAASGTTDATSSGGAHTHTITTDSTGTGSAFSIMNPYFTVYFWKRTA